MGLFEEQFVEAFYERLGLEVGGFLGTILWQSQLEKYCPAEASYTELQYQNFHYMYKEQARKSSEDAQAGYAQFEKVWAG